MESAQDSAKSETADDSEASSPAPEFRVDVPTIESVSKEQQACELQSLELEVFDHATLEKGIIAQVNVAIQSAVPSQRAELGHTNLEDGELDEEVEESEFLRKIRLGEATPFDQSEEGKQHQEKENSDLFQRYMDNQAKLQTSHKKKSNCATPVVVRPLKRKPKSPKEFVPSAKGKSERANKQRRKSAEDETKKYAKKRKKQPKKPKTKDDDFSLPKDGNTSTVEHTSGSEYLPSDSEESESERPKSRKSPKKVAMNEVATDDCETEWDSSEDEGLKKRKVNKELDDGDPHYFTKRLKSVQRPEYTEELAVVLNDFKCPKIVWDSLYKYQQVAVKWFWELNEKRCGGILGDEMGLGKTIQVIAFLAGLFVSELNDYDTGYSGLGPTLIVCPTTVMHQWVREFHKWFPIIRVAILHESGTYANTGKEKSRLIDSIHSHDYGVLITSYAGLVQHSKKILDKQWHYVILDEGHKIRNNQAQVTVVAKQLDTPHRLILSGSPLQNNLKELWSLFDFVYPGKLGTLQVFVNVFHMPILAGGYTNASPLQVLQASKCARILKDTISPYLLRRMKRDVDAHIKLPPKTEQVLFCKLTDEQRELYLNYLHNVNIEDMMRGRAQVFVGLINLRKICNHPDLYSEGSRKDFSSNASEDNSDDGNFGYWGRAGKMIVVRTLLKIWNQQNHRVLLFSQTQKMLLILEDFVKRCGYKYLKLDGTTSISSRQPLVDKFNKDTSYFVMLLTTKVGGLGINLTGANRVVIYDPDWNPATDIQARERAWRIGQEKDVTVYRLITAGTIEEKIYHRQIFKQFLSNKVLEDPKQRRFFKSNDLSELFTLSETVKDGTNETAAIFAGTGSEVKLSKLLPRRKPKYSVAEESEDPKITFSESKIEQMKQLAQKLSKKFSNAVASASLKPVENSVEPRAGCSKNVAVDIESQNMEIYGPDGQISKEALIEMKTPKSSVDSVKKESPSKEKTDENDNHTNEVSSRRTSLQEESSRKKTRKHDRHGQFEGHDVPHLIKCRKIKRHRESGEKDDTAGSQDDYVLHKLFAKSGIETALRHDMIMGSGPHDYAIVEAEADKVAQEAIKALKASSAEVPVVRKPLFKPTAQGSAILGAIKKRNLVVDAHDVDNNLVKSLVTWLCSKGGVSSTDKIIEEFSAKVGPGKSPLFKSLLGKIASFHRGPDNIGYWTVKNEFKM